MVVEVLALIASIEIPYPVTPHPLFEGVATGHPPKLPCVYHDQRTSIIIN